MTASPHQHTPGQTAADPARALDAVAHRYAALQDRLRQVIVGQREAVEHLIIAAFCQGHALLEGPPGLAKTLMVRTLASSLKLDFRRVQFTPDMMPSDVLGAEVLHADPATGERSMRFIPGPVFANIVLADEINRTPPKTQAALLEAMAERQVSVGGRTRPLPAPFIVCATQNPIEQEGTYPLPEAQLDRFMFAVRLTYPKAAEERLIAAEADRIEQRAASVEPIFDGRDLLAIRRMIGQTPVSEHVVDYAVALARATRPDDETCPKALRRLIAWGAGPRAGQTMLLAARCLALLEGEPTPGTHHVRRVAPAALRRRIVLGYAASAEGVDAEQVVERVIRETPEPAHG